MVKKQERINKDNVHIGEEGEKLISSRETKGEDTANSLKDLKQEQKKKEVSYVGASPGERTDTKKGVAEKKKKKTKKRLKDRTKGRQQEVEKKDKMEKGVAKEVQTEVEKEIAKEVQTEVEKEIAKEVQTEVKKEIAKEVQTEVEKEIAKEVQTEVKKEIAKEVQTEVEKEMANEVQREDKDGEGMDGKGANTRAEKETGGYPDYYHPSFSFEKEKKKKNSNVEMWNVHGSASTNIYFNNCSIESNAFSYKDSVDSTGQEGLKTGGNEQSGTVVHGDTFVCDDTFLTNGNRNDSSRNDSSRNDSSRSDSNRNDSNKRTYCNENVEGNRNKTMRNGNMDAHVCTYYPGTERIESINEERGKCAFEGDNIMKLHTKKEEKHRKVFLLKHEIFPSSTEVINSQGLNCTYLATTTEKKKMEKKKKEDYFTRDNELRNSHSATSVINQCNVEMQTFLNKDETNSGVMVKGKKADDGDTPKYSQWKGYDDTPLFNEMYPTPISNDSFSLTNKDSSNKNSQSHFDPSIISSSNKNKSEHFPTNNNGLLEYVILKEGNTHKYIFNHIGNTPYDSPFCEYNSFLLNCTQYDSNVLNNQCHQNKLSQHFCEKNYNKYVLKNNFCEYIYEQTKQAHSDMYNSVGGETVKQEISKMDGVSPNDSAFIGEMCQVKQPSSFPIKGKSSYDAEMAEVVRVTEAAAVAGVTEAAAVAGVTEAAEVAGVTEVAEAAEVAGATEAAEVAGVTEVAEAEGAIEAANAAAPAGEAEINAAIGTHPKREGVSIFFKDDRRFFNFDIPSRELIERKSIQIIELVSEGSFGTVYKAMWNDQIIAVKKFHTHMSLEGMRSIAREINTYRTVSHQFIVKYYGVCIDESFIGIALEYFSNGNIFDTLHNSQTNLSYEMRLNMCIQLADVTKYLHDEKKLIHRDLKTSNLLLDDEFNLKICDFGKTMKMRKDGKIVLEDNGGSPRYMAPECFIEDNTINEKSDVWGLACCFIEIFGNQIPFQHVKHKEDVVIEILVNKKKPNIPHWFHPEFIRMLERSFSRDPSERPSCEEFLKLFLKYLPQNRRKHQEGV
ncbi:protein kinase, putative [Plasmodium ovale]|uniref:Protein kinase, putative n=1 Tax=Plasmodium ovale TaxID=36330 RepID=A0A1C3KML6_PLAOA|nr:protein kinase, putative [Plasmodium ovale]